MSDEVFEDSADVELTEQELEVVAGGTEENHKFVSHLTNSGPDRSSTLVLKSMNAVASAFQFIALDLNDVSTTRAVEN
ncbi:MULTISPECIES: hypothetical protein [Nostocales]|uniref:Bacteriocin n=3 Tax=Nostocales TaxID=1161 RepID=A0A0C1QXM7_9CYAN|nr:hypothetical protein [Tolypothrix bouteillei]KAF3886235.1 hypothetical protein DA73_0400012675 [Tolypothrix bouteillei VB521301]